ncbi:tyrosine-type recombinase/integrase [Rhodococcus sp. LB1]|uniref:tyrosine-type recombinase/integrase n=1 Tax=Rhodococcus sp. LB1 TaxID=1807499 RepID=UPI00077AC8AC|nr:site-specific integrase [Rhodococcus sp. LB1]KXX59704.1 hypothetical protein AZG88_06705 [Rhodococcus sp. LB1]
MAERKHPRRSWGTVKRLKSGRYRPEFTGPDGVVYSSAQYGEPATYRAKIDADHWLLSIRRKIDLGTWTPPGSAPDTDEVTVHDYAEKWLAERKLKPTTRDDYADMLRLFIHPALGALKVRDVTPSTVRTWYAALKTGPTRKAHTYSLLRTVLGTAVHDEILPSNPARIRGAGQSPASTRATDVMLTGDEIGRLADAMPDRLRAAVLLLAWCGPRSGELRELRRKDVAKDAAAVRISRGVTTVEGQFIVSTPKTRAGGRTVSVPPHIRKAVLDHLGRHVGASPDALLFPDMDGGHLSDFKFRRPFRNAAVTIGRPDLRIHDLRHVAGTLASLTGATLKETMGRLGHVTPRAALIYQEVAAGRDAEIAERMSKLLGDTDDDGSQE